MYLHKKQAGKAEALPPLECAYGAKSPRKGRGRIEARCGGQCHQLKPPALAGARKPGGLDARLQQCLYWFCSPVQRMCDPDASLMDAGSPRRAGFLVFRASACRPLSGQLFCGAVRLLLVLSASVCSPRSRDWPGAYAGAGSCGPGAQR